MSEKRFRLSDRHLSEISNDNAILDGKIPCTQRHVCKLLNEFNEENKELKEVLLKVLNQLYNAESSLIYEYSALISDDKKKLNELFKEKYDKYGWGKEND